MNVPHRDVTRRLLLVALVVSFPSFFTAVSGRKLEMRNKAVLPIRRCRRWSGLFFWVAPPLRCSPRRRHHLGCRAMESLLRIHVQSTSILRKAGILMSFRAAARRMAFTKTAEARVFGMVRSGSRMTLLPTCTTPVWRRVNGSRTISCWHTRWQWITGRGIRTRGLYGDAECLHLHDWRRRSSVVLYQYQAIEYTISTSLPHEKYPRFARVRVTGQVRNIWMSMSKGITPKPWRFAATRSGTAMTTPQHSKRC